MSPTDGGRGFAKGTQRSLLAHSRAKGASPEALNEYFDILEEKYGIQSEPGSIFNKDETGMPLDLKNLQVVVPKGMKNPY